MNIFSSRKGAEFQLRFLLWVIICLSLVSVASCGKYSGKLSTSDAVALTRGCQLLELGYLGFTAEDEFSGNWVHIYDAREELSLVSYGESKDSNIHSLLTRLDSLDVNGNLTDKKDANTGRSVKVPKADLNQKFTSELRTLNADCNQEVDTYIQKNN